MKNVNLPAPFTRGMVTDLPAYEIGPQNSSFAQDGYSPNGFYKQRAGWSYDGTTADVASNLQGIYRVSFGLADVTRTITTAANGNVYIHNAAAGGTAVSTTITSSKALPRCVYNDELVICAQDGTTPVIRYSGSDVLNASVTTVNWVANNSTLHSSAGSWSASLPSGSYVWLYSSAVADLPPQSMARVLARISTADLSIEGVKSSQSVSGVPAAVSYGITFPCVSIYDAGTGSFDNATNVFNGTGVQWTTGGWGTVQTNDGLLVIRPGGTSAVHQVFGINTDTQIDLHATTKADTNLNYAILRNCPFKDAAAHKESLWGTGVAQFPNRVYVGPPGWNMAFPPGFTLPYDPTVLPESDNVNDFLLAYSDVPSPTDGDHNVAILTSPNPLLVLKRKSVYAVTGDYFGRSIDLLADGAGCIDIRSAWSYDEGQFWCGENGIFWYVNGTVQDLTRGKINREWRSLARDFDYGTSDYCTLQVVSGHLKVDITTAGGTIQRSYLCDLRDQSWQSRISNANSRAAFTSRISGEKEKALWVSDARQGRVMDFAPALDGSGTAKDDAGSAPRLKAWTTSALAQNQGINGDSRLVDLDVHANVVDSDVAGSTKLQVSVVSGGGVSNEADATKTLTAINSDTVDRIDRKSYRVARRGRFHQAQFEVDTLGTDTAATKVEIHQIVATVREGRGRS